MIIQSSLNLRLSTSAKSFPRQILIFIQPCVNAQNVIVKRVRKDSVMPPESHEYNFLTNYTLLIKGFWWKHTDHNHKALYLYKFCSAKQMSSEDAWLSLLKGCIPRWNIMLCGVFLNKTSFHVNEIDFYKSGTLSVLRSVSLLNRSTEQPCVHWNNVK